MFRRRRRGISFGKILGLITLMIGVIILFIVIPVQLWFFILGCVCICLGLFFYRIF